MAETNTAVQTTETVRKEAETAYAAQHPAPEPPTPPRLARPGVIRVGSEAHVWIDVITESLTYGTPRQPHAALYIVERHGNEDKRIQGDLTLDAIDALIEELIRVRASVDVHRDYAEATSQHREAERLWESLRDEYARQQVAAWQKAQKK